MDQVLTINFKWDKLDSELGEHKPQIILHIPASLDFTGLLPRLHPVAVGEAAVGSLDKSTPCTACCPAKLLGAGIAADPNIPTLSKSLLSIVATAVTLEKIDFLTRIKLEL